MSNITRADNGKQGLKMCRWLWGHAVHEVTPHISLRDGLVAGRGEVVGAQDTAVDLLHSTEGIVADGYCASDPGQLWGSLVDGAADSALVQGYRQSDS